MNLVPRVLTVEDEPDLRLILQDNLEFEGYEVLSASTGEEGLDIAMAKQPDLVLLDLLLPRMSGYEVCRRLRAEQFTMPIIMLTARNAEMDRVAGLELGADDYVGKPFDPRELLARIRSVLRRTRPTDTGGSAADRRTVRLGRCLLDLDTRQLFTLDGAEVPITAMEFDLLAAFARHPNRVLSREQLLDLAHNNGNFPFDRSIDIRVARLRQKIEFHPDKPQAIKTVRGAGYIFLPGGEMPEFGS
jgi:DNA-binding response OmpR family regulator